MLELQRLAGNQAVSELLSARQAEPELRVQRSPAADAVARALDRPTDHGPGDFRSAWMTLDALPMEQLLATFAELNERGYLGLLTGHTDDMLAVNKERLIAAMHAADLASSPSRVTPDSISTTAHEMESLPDAQQQDVLQFMVERKGASPEVVRTTLEGLAAMMGTAQMSVQLSPAALAHIKGPVGPGAWARPGKQWVGYYIGNEAHAGIAAEYVAEHPADVVFTNYTKMQDILARVGRDPTKVVTDGDLSDKPDIANMTRNHLYEIKPEKQESVAVSDARYYQKMFAAAGIPMQLGPLGEPGTEGAIPAPAGYYLFQCRQPGAIVYNYRRGRFVPVPVPANQKEDDTQGAYARVPPLSQEQQRYAPSPSTGMTILMLLLILALVPVGA